MKTIKDLIEKYPQILNMDLNGLEFFRGDMEDYEIKNLIEDFTDVTISDIEKLISDFISINAKYKQIPIKMITDVPSVKIKVKNNKVYFNDKYNDNKSNITDLKKIYLELIYYATGEYYEEDEDYSYLSIRNFNKVKELIEKLGVVE